MNLIFFITVAACWCFAAVSVCFAQDKDGLTRYVETGKSFKAPVSVSMASSIYGNIPLDRPFTAQNDWLKNFTIGFINNSEKAITHFSLNIRFPRTEDQKNKPGFSYPLEYGESPYADRKGEFLVSTAKPILKGEKIILTLSDTGYDRIIEGLKEGGFPSEMYNVELFISTIGYSDDTIWRAGRFYTIDKNNPGKPVRKSSFR